VLAGSTFLCGAPCGATWRLGGDKMQPRWRLARDSIGWRQAQRQHCLTGLHAVRHNDSILCSEGRAGNRTCWLRSTYRAVW
jgi:hypothetical protein